MRTDFSNLDFRLGRVFDWFSLLLAALESSGKSFFVSGAKILELEFLESWQLALEPAHARPYFLMMWAGANFQGATVLFHHEPLANRPGQYNHMSLP